MSTKSSISYSDDYHFYKEAFDEDNIYLQLDHAYFKAQPSQVTVRIPKSVLEQIIKDYESSPYRDNIDET